LDGKENLEMSELAGLHPPAQEMRSPAIGQGNRATPQKNVSAEKPNAMSETAQRPLSLPVDLLALGDEIRALKDYCARGLLTPEEAQERIDDWQISYPPGWSDIAELVHLRRGAPISVEAGV
jgi:hypothetical protein